MESACNRVQEEIVWSKELSEEAQQHVLSCESCKHIAFGFSNLNSVMEQHFDAAVPDGFADRVMERINKQSSLTTLDWSAILAQRFDALLGTKAMQLCMTSFGVVFALLNLVRFVFGVVLPATG